MHLQQQQQNCEKLDVEPLRRNVDFELRFHISFSYKDGDKKMQLR
jgi:hypothetical protein